MPKILRENVPPQVLEHLLQRMREREIRPDQSAFLADWLDKESEVPEGEWFTNLNNNLAFGRSLEFTIYRAFYCFDTLKCELQQVSASGVVLNQFLNWYYSISRYDCLWSR